MRKFSPGENFHQFRQCMLLAKMIFLHSENFDTFAHACAYAHSNSRTPPTTIWKVKAGSQCDTRPYIVLIRETHKFIIQNVEDFLTTRHKNATQGNTTIGSKSILASCCISTSVDAKMTQCNALFSVVL